MRDVPKSEFTVYDSKPAKLNPYDKECLTDKVSLIIKGSSKLNRVAHRFEIKGG